MKYQVRIKETNNGAEICDIERIEKHTKIYENSGDEGRFDVKVEHFNNQSDIIDFVYRMKLYISKDDAKELVKTFLYI